MRSLIAFSLLVALIATQVAAVHCPAVGDIGATEGTEGAQPAAQHHDHEPPRHSHRATPSTAPETSAGEEHREQADAHADHANQGHEHHRADGCTMLLACGGAAVPREGPASRGAEGPELSYESPTLLELRSTLLCTDPPPPKPRA